MSSFLTAKGRHRRCHDGPDPLGSSHSPPGLPLATPSLCTPTTFATLLKPKPLPCYRPLSLPEVTR